MCSGFLLLALLSTAPNPHLDLARGHLDALEYREALTEIDTALKAPDNSRDVLLEILMLRGITAASLGEHALAVESFRAVLSLDPRRELPRELAPRVREAFEAGRAWSAQHGALAFLHDPEPSDGRVHVKLERDLLSLARRVRFHFEGDHGTFLAVGGELRNEEASAVPPPEARGGWWAELLGLNDAVLAKIGDRQQLLPLPARAAVSSVAPQLERPGPVSSKAKARHRPLAYGLLGAAGTSVLAGSFFGISAARSRAEIAGATRDGDGRVVGVTQAHAYALDQQSRRDDALAWTLWGTAGALAAAGGALWWWGRERPVQVTPTAGGVSVSGVWP